MNETLQSFLKLIENLPSRKEFTDAFAVVVKRTKEFEAALTRDFKDLAQTISQKADASFEKLTNRIDAFMAQQSGRIDTALKEQETALNFVRDTARAVQSGKDGKDGINGTNGVDGTPGRDGSPDTGDQIVQKINEAEAQIVPEAVVGYTDLQNEVKSIALRPEGRIGAKGIGLYVAGKKKILTAQQINLIAGTGITISYAFANGRNDITITATGTASLSPITVTGTVDDSNKSFTAASTPNLVIVNGASYRDGHGATIVGTAITLDNPVGTGGDIYCL